MFDALVAANAIQSCAPPAPLVSVTVIGFPPTTFVVLTESDGSWLIENGVGPDSPPPGGGLFTVTCAVPIAAISLAGIAACSCVALTKVVVRSAPFQRTTDEARKLLPMTVSVKAVPPTFAEAGDSDVTAGPPGTTVTVGLVATRV